MKMIDREELDVFVNELLDEQQENKDEQRNDI